MAEDNAIQIRTNDTTNIFPLAVRGPTLERRLIMTNSNSILSSVFIKSIDPATTVNVRWFQDTSGTIEEDLERQDLTSHPALTAASPSANTVLVTRIHNKPKCEIEIVGGNAEFGVYASARDETASDLDSALKLEAQLVNFLQDKGIPVAGVVESNGEWKFLRFDDAGALKVSGVLSVSSSAASGRIQIVNINSTGWTQLPSVALTDRVAISVQNRSGFEVAINYDTPGSFTGRILDDRASFDRDLLPSAVVYGRAPSNITTPTIPLIVEELAN